MANEIRASFKMDTKQANQALKSLGRTSNKTQGQFSKFGSSLKQLGGRAAGAVKSFATMKVGLLGVTAGIGAFGVAVAKTIKAYDVQIDAINRLNNALANQGNLLPGTSERLQQYAADLQDVTTFGDEAIIQTQALAATFGAGEDDIKRITQATLDFATAQRIDLQAATLLLGKAFVGETGSLSRYGIVVDENIPKSEKFSAVLDQLNQRFGGSAQLAAKQFSGQMKQLGNTAGDALEGIGKFFVFLAESAGSGGAIQFAIDGLERLTTFFEVDLIIGIGKARGFVLDFGAGFIDVIASVIGALEKIPIIGDQFAGTAQGLTDFADALRFGADELRNEAEAAAAASGAQTDFVNAVKQAPGPTSEAAEAAQAYADEIATLADKLSGAGLLTEAQKATDAIRELGGVSELSVTGIESLSGLIDDLRKNSEQLTPELLEVSKALNMIALTEGLDDLLANHEEFIVTDQEWNDVLTETVGLFDEMGQGVPGIVDGITEDMGGLPPVTLDWNTALSASQDLMSALGVESDSTFGKILKGVETVLGILGGAGEGGGLFGQISGLFGGGEGGLLSGLSGLFSGGGEGGGIGGLLGGLLGGGDGGALTGGIGGIISKALSAVPVVGIFASFAPQIIAGVSALGGALISGIKSLFGGGESPGAQAARIVADDFGAQIGPELEAQIAAAGERLDIGAAASGLFLSEIFATGTQDVNTFAEKIRNVFNTDDTLLPFEERMKSVGKATQDLIANFDQLGASGQASVEQLLRDAAATGVEFEGMNELAAKLATTLTNEATAGGDAFLNKVNELGLTGRESLAFLRNTFGSQLPEDILASANQLLGLNEQVAATAGGANQIGTEFANLPGIASEAVNGIATTFQEGSASITEGLQPVSDKMATEIKEAGQTTSQAIEGSFAATSAAIQSGLTNVASVYTSQIAPAALTAADATRDIAEAAREAANAARDINFPGGGGIPDFQHGGFVPEGPSPRLVTVAGPGTGGEFMTPARGGINVTMNNTVNANGGTNVREIVDALERNQADQGRRLQRILTKG